MKLDHDLVSIQDVRHKLQLSFEAQHQLATFSQLEIDKIIETMSIAAFEAAEELARLAVEETGFGNVEDKATKNRFAAKDVYDAIKDMKTVGIVHEDTEKKIWEIAEPMGVIAGIIPSTNPTSTIIFKSLIAIKTRNTIVFSPHPSALTCSIQAAKVMNDAAISAGAPNNVIQCLEHSTLEASKELMTHKKTNLILATGGPAMVKAAYSSGKPAYGVGPGNVPVYVHQSADVSQAAKQIIESKAFDYGTICASEQAVVIDETIKNDFLTELQKNGAYLLSTSEKTKLASFILKDGHLNSAIVGKSPQKVAELAGISVPETAKILVAEETQINKITPFAIEKLSPILALYTVKDWREGSDSCLKLLEIGGLGHTFGIHAKEEEVIRAFALKQPASRIIVNSGTTFGAIGVSTNLFPSLTLGCGSYGNNITSDNIGPKLLLNMKRVAFGIRENASAEVTPVASDFEINEADVAKIVMQVLNQLSNHQ